MRYFTRELKDKKDLVGVEIGVWRGDHAKELLDGLSIKMLHLVDPYKKKYDYKHHPQEIYDDSKKSALEKLADYKNKKWYFIPSVKATKKFKDCSFDFVYIDGDHRTESAVSDILAWTPKIKKGGIVAGHDYNFGPVRDAVDCVVPIEELSTDGVDWYFKI